MVTQEIKTLLDTADECLVGVFLDAKPVQKLVQLLYGFAILPTR